MQAPRPLARRTRSVSGAHGEAGARAVGAVVTAASGGGTGSSPSTVQSTTAPATQRRWPSAEDPPAPQPPTRRALPHREL